jgi:cysteinyl-tRNA synthetase
VLVGVGPVQDLTEPAAGGNRGDLLALRLALLSRPYRQPVTLTQAALADAAESAGRWRRRVAEWASQPSRPIPADAATTIRDAFDGDLNTVAAVDLLRSVESRRDVPAGREVRDVPVRRSRARPGAPPRDRPLTGEDAYALACSGVA